MPPAPAPEAGRPAHSAGPVDAGTVRQHWPAVLDAVKGQSRVAWVLLNNATVHTLEDGVLVIGFAREGEAKGFAARGSDQELVTALADVLGVRLRVRALAGLPPGGPPPSRPAAGPAPAGPVPPVDSPAGGAAAGDAGQARRGAAASAAGSAAGPAAPPPHQAAPGGDRPGGDWPDEPVDPADGMPAPAGLSGMDLIARQLGGQIIAEIDGE